MTAFAGPSFQKRLNVTIPPMSSADVDVLAESNFCALKYSVCVKNNSNNEIRTVEMMVSKTKLSFENSVGPSLGDNVNFNTDYIKTGTDGKLVIVNNELSPIVATVLRTIIT